MSFALLSGKCLKQIAVLIGSIPGYLVLAEVMSFAHFLLVNIGFLPWATRMVLIIVF